MLGKKLCIGDTVHLFAPRFGDTPIAAIVTRIDFDPASDDTKHISITVFPPGAASIPLTSIQHRSLHSGKCSHDLDGWWDWPSPSAAVGL